MNSFSPEWLRGLGPRHKLPQDMHPLASFLTL